MKNISLIIVLFVLAACGSVLPKGPLAPTLYTLSAPINKNTDMAHIPVSLRILMPQAAPGLETEKIALRKVDRQLDYYTDVRWSGSLTALLQSQLAQSFDNAHRLDSVSNDLVAVNQDYSLLIEIQDFQAEYQSSMPIAHVRLTTKLIQAKSNKIITTTIYEDREPAAQNTMHEVVKALDAAYQRTSIKIVADVLKILQANKKESHR